MFNYTCLNPIAGVGLDLFSDDYKKIDRDIHCFDYLRDLVTNKGGEVLERNDVINDSLWDTSKIEYLVQN